MILEECPADHHVPPDANRVELFDPSLCSPAPGNRSVSPSDVEDLLPTMADPAIGQRQPGVVYDDPDAVGRYRVADGNRRVLSCRILGLPFKAFRLPGPISMLDLIKVRLTENVIRKAMSPREVAADIAEYIRHAGITQAEAAAHFGFSPSKVCKLLDLLELPPAVQALIDSGQLGQDVGRIIASVPTPELRLELAERAVKNDMKRDAVEKAAAAMRGSKRKVVVREKRYKDGPGTVIVPGDWTGPQVTAWLAEFVKRFRRGGDGFAASGK